MEISKIQIGQDTYDIKDDSALSTSDMTNAINTELYGSTTKPNGVSVVTTQNIQNVLENIEQNIDVVYKDVKYNISRIEGTQTLTIPGTDPVYVVSVNSNISSVALQNNPTYGHSCHLIFKPVDNSSQEYTVFIGHNSPNRICPTSDGISLTVPKANEGYVEIDFMNVGNEAIGDEIYVRGL